jgi:putative oxidoreductase
MTEYKMQIAELLVRIFAGILFLFQGYDKLFRIKVPGVIHAFEGDAMRFHIPRPLLSGVSYFTSIAEFSGGFLLILGLFTNYALVLLSLDLLLVCFAFTYMEPMWNMKNVFPRLLLILILLIFPEGNNVFSLDSFLNK